MMTIQCQIYISYDCYTIICVNYAIIEIADKLWIVLIQFVVSII
jgi:hypothetical protein